MEKLSTYSFGLYHTNIKPIESYVVVIDDQRCIYMKIWPKEENVVNTHKLILKSKYTKKNLK